MLIIGEKINSTSKIVYTAIAARDASAIQELARRQAEAGANYIDVNAGAFSGDEPQRLAWLVETIQAAVETPLCLDTPNPAAMEAGLKAYSAHGAYRSEAPPILNSLTAAKSSYDFMLPLALEYGAKIIALCMDENGIPAASEGRYNIAQRLIGQLAGAGVKPDDIYIDPLVKPISTGTTHGIAAIETIRLIKAGYPGSHIVCGLSNVSYGLPRRELINQAFLMATMAAGIDCAILNPMDNMLMSLIAAAEAVLGMDENCGNYLEKYRNG